VSYSHKGKRTTQFVRIDALAETKKTVEELSDLQKTDRRMGGAIGEDRKAAKESRKAEFREA
jgi:hypothetical protein